MAVAHIFRSVQALRAVAALLVVVNHALITAGHRSQIGVDGHPILGRLGVEIFFAISGFVMIRVTDPLRPGRAPIRTAGRFLWARAVRIVPLYWLCTMLVMLADLVGSRRSGDDVSPARLIASLLFLPSTAANGLVQPVLYVGWTLQFEMVFYLMVAIALAVQVSPVRLCVPVLAGLAALSTVRPPDSGAGWFYADSATLSFAVGMLTARIAAPGPHRRAAWVVLVAATSAHVLVCGVRAVGPDPTGIVVALVVPLIFVPTVMTEHRVGASVPRWATAAGATSYTLYLTHPFVSTAVADGLSALGDAARSPMLFVTAVVVTPLLTAPFIHRYVERPITRLPATLVRRRPGPA